MRDEHLTRRQRLDRRVERRLYLCLGSAFVAIVVGVLALAPSASARLLVTVYPALDCVECGHWMKYLNDHGFRAVAAPPARRSEIHQALRLPPGFRGPVVTIVNGLTISGFVPAREIHRLIEGELGKKVIGVAVRDGSAGPWKPVKMTSQGVTVFAVLPGGMLRPVQVYHGAVAPGSSPYLAAVRKPLPIRAASSTTRSTLPLQIFSIWCSV